MQHIGDEVQRKALLSDVAAKAQAVTTVGLEKRLALFCVKSDQNLLHDCDLWCCRAARAKTQKGGALGGHLSPPHSQHHYIRSPGRTIITYGLVT